MPQYRKPTECRRYRTHAEHSAVKPGDWWGLIFWVVLIIGLLALNG